MSRCLLRRRQGAGSGIRTHTLGWPAPDFKSGMSADFIIPARVGRNITPRRKLSAKLLCCLRELCCKELQFRRLFLAFVASSSIRKIVESHPAVCLPLLLDEALPLHLHPIKYRQGIVHQAVLSTRQSTNHLPACQRLLAAPARSWPLFSSLWRKHTTRKLSGFDDPPWTFGLI